VLSIGAGPDSQFLSGRVLKTNKKYNGANQRTNQLPTKTISHLRRSDQTLNEVDYKSFCSRGQQITYGLYTTTSLVVFHWRAAAHQVAIAVDVVDSVNGWPELGELCRGSWMNGLGF